MEKKKPDQDQPKSKTSKFKNKFFQSEEQKKNKPKPISNKVSPPFNQFKFWINSANTALFFNAILIIVTVIIECIYFAQPWVGFVQIAVVLVAAFLMMLLVGFFWVNELYMAAWTTVYFPFVALIPIFVAIACRKVVIDKAGIDIKVKI
jgi:hypothetical protein